MYSTLDIWLGIILGGIAGCLATALVAQATKGVPFAKIAGSPGKHLWAVIFAIPIPLLLALGGGEAIGYILALVWLVMAPTVAAKTYFGPKELSWGTLMTFHVGYAVVALVVYLIVINAI